MAALTGTIDINASPGSVFAYVADPSLRTEWQQSVQTIEIENPDVVGVGLRVGETRHVPGGPRTFTWEVVEFEPDRRWAFRGVDGPVRTYLAVTFEGLEGGRTRVVTDLDFEGHGMGRLFAAFARRGARKEMPRDLEQLKRRVEQHL